MTCSLVHRRWQLEGQLQGVGFRPFVYRVARELGICGFVRNDCSSVTIEAQGEPDLLEQFIMRICRELPPAGRIMHISREELPLVELSGFEIRASRGDSRRRPVVTVDTAVCDDCLRELFDASDFRYRYPLINCTNCGPRYSIIRAMPYDRINTTMRHFQLCEKCHQQYANPIDRRFHAQPVACHTCGPRVGLHDMAGGDICWDSAISAAARLLGDGRIIAIKGIGGFHLACRADDEQAVTTLRARKARDAKPFALMCANIDVARRLVHLGAEAQRELTSPAAPILLARKRALAGIIAPSVAMGNHSLGVMLPYTPLHHLLFAELAPRVDLLVMTSANLTDEPLVKDNDEAVARLKGIADAILLHERDIERSIDDSVLLDMGAGRRPLPIRRARGYVPGIIRLINHPRRKHTEGLCVGGELKNSIAVVRDDEVILSHHLGDLKHALAYEYFRKAIEDMCRLFEVRPAWIAHDLHPAYLSTQWARELAAKLDVPLIGVQHHHAHAAAVLAEHGIAETALAIVCDGVGYGTDGTAWGGELLLVNGASFARLAHLRPIPLAGGDAAARDTRRCAAGVLWESGASLDGLLDDRPEQAMLSAMLERGTNVVRSSAAGRLFDAVAAILGVCMTNTHEAQAAMALESLASSAGPVKQLRIPPAKDLDLLPYIAALRERRARGEEVAQLAAEFHEYFARSWAAATIDAAHATGVKIVGLSGGVFCNEIVTRRIAELLDLAGLRVLRHEVVPPNDGGLSLGQAAIALAREDV